MEKINLNKHWQYTQSDLVNKLLLQSAARWQPVTLPHDVCVEIERSPQAPAGLNEGYMQSAGLYYKKVFHVSKDAVGMQVWLEFEGIAGLSQVWVNGHFVGKHRNPYTSLLLDISEVARPGENNEILVFTDNRAKPNSRWYLGCGIYRHVWLHIGQVQAVLPQTLQAVTQSIQRSRAILDVSAKLARTDQCDVVCVVADNNGNELIRQSSVCSDGQFSAELVLDNITPWSPDSPILYNLSVEVVSDGKSDIASCRIGLRTIEMTAEKGFLLNGKSLKLRGGCIHHDLGILGAAAHDAAERRKVKLLMDSGYNALRLAHNPFSPALLDACDELGMLVVAEAFDEWVLGRTSFGHYQYFESDWEKDLADMIRQDFNHPSIFMWSTGNEVEERDGSADGFAWSKRLADKVKTLDSSRPTSVTACSLPAEYAQKVSTGATGNQILNMAHDNFASGEDLWGDATQDFFEPVDVAGYNYKTVRYAFDANKFPDRIIYGSETYPVLAFDSWQATLDNDHVIGDFVWTAMDYLGESGLGRFEASDAMLPASPGWPWLTAHCGDLDLIGSQRPQGAYREVVWKRDRQPRLFVLPPHLTGKRLARMSWTWDPVEPCYTYPGSDGQAIEAHVYANADEVELLQNGKSLGRKPVGKNEQYKAVFELNYAPGSLEAVAYVSGEPCGRAGLSTLGQTAAIELVPDRASIRGDGLDLSFVKIRAVDAAGRPAYLENGAVTLDLEGGELLALGNADPMPDRLLPFAGPTCPLFHGEALAVIRSQDNEPGCRLTAALGDTVSASLKIAFEASETVPAVLVSDVVPGVLDIPLRDLMSRDESAKLIRQMLPELVAHPMFDKMGGMTLRRMSEMGGGMLPADSLVKLESELKTLV